MSNQPSLTIISVTGHSDYTLGSMYAIMRSYQALQPKIARLAAILISPDKPHNLPTYIKHIQCKSFTYREYNALAFSELGQFVETDFALIVQDDGWVWDGDNWREEFFQYDYIGPPIARYIENEAGKIAVHYPDVWQANYLSPPKGWYEPQNGGFSLRSKAMLDAPKKYGLTYPFSLKVTTQEPIEIQYIDENMHEDVLLSGVHRAFLEQQGLRFAPREIAFYFATENALPLETYNAHHEQKIHYHQALGRHMARIITLIEENTALIKGVKFEALEHIVADLNLQNLLLKGYRLKLPREYSFNGHDIMVYAEGQVVHSYNLS